jgi:hypothetical protein
MFNKGTERKTRVLTKEGLLKYLLLSLHMVLFRTVLMECIREGKLRSRVGKN